MASEQVLIELYHEDGSPAGDYPFRGAPLVGDVLVKRLEDLSTDVLVSIVGRRWTLDGKLQLIIHQVDLEDEEYF